MVELEELVELLTRNNAKTGRTGRTGRTGLTGLTFVQVLAFECIESLKSRFREDVEPVEADCPKMCRGKFKKSALKGFSLQELYEALGDSKAIDSTVVHEGEEDGHIAPAELYVNNPIVDGWNNIITRDGRIFWEDFYKLDVASRDTIPVPEGPSLAKPVPPSIEAPVRGSLQAPVPPSIEAPVRGSLEAPVPPSVEAPGQQSFQPAVEEIMKAMEEGFQKMDMKIGDVSTRLTDMSARLRDVEERVFKTNVVDGDLTGEAGRDWYFDNAWAGNSGEGDVGQGEGDIQGEGDVGQKTDEVDAEDNAWAMVIVNQFPEVANQFPEVVEVEGDKVEGDKVEGDEDEGDKVAAVRGRKRKPSKFCKTPYTRRTKQRKT